MMKRVATVVLMCAFAATAAMAAPPAKKAPAKKAAAPAAKQAGPTADAVFASLYKRIETLNKYTFIFDYTEVKKDKTEARTCEFKYAGPEFIYLSVTDGDNKGSQVVYNAKKNKKAVRAKQSFMPMAISVGKDDPRLAGVFVTDWNSDLIAIKKMIAGAKPVMVGSDKIKGRDAYKIEFTGLKGDFNKIDLWIDKKENLLLQYEYFKNNEFSQRKTWYGFKLDAPLTDDDFKL